MDRVDNEDVLSDLTDARDQLEGAVARAVDAGLSVGEIADAIGAHPEDVQSLLNDA